MSTKSEKVKNMEKIQNYEKIIMRLEDWNPKVNLEISTNTGKAMSSEERNEVIAACKDAIAGLNKKNEQLGMGNKMYLSELIDIENAKFGSNNLILSPVGSGKSVFIDKLINEEDRDVLILVSNTALKDSVAPNKNSVKKERADRRYTSKNKNIYGDKKHNAYVMSYSEFGERVRYNNKFAEKFSKIFCDEIHSLIDYQLYNDDTGLASALKYLISKREGKEIYYFTATDEKLIQASKRTPDLLSEIKVYDYRNHPNIRQYMSLAEYKINHFAQIRPHLKARFKTFSYFGHKAFAYTQRIETQKAIAQMAEEEGFKPILLWSVNNNKKTMDEEQLRVRDHLLLTGEIPDPYNFLIINSSMQEGWNLTDSRVKLAIMDTLSETEYTQALGRIRRDVDTLILKTVEHAELTLTVEIPNEYLNTPLTKIERDDLCRDLNLVNANGSQAKWFVVSTLIDEDSGYVIKNHTKLIDGKRTRVVTIMVA